jgi:hypothetical protein
MDLKALVNYTISTNILTSDIKLGEKSHTCLISNLPLKCTTKTQLGTFKCGNNHLQFSTQPNLTSTLI